MKELLHLFDPEMGNSVANIRIQLRYIKKLIEAIISDEDHDIDDIKAVIPEAASEENKLTDKNYVDTELEGKIDVPEEEPTDGQILSSQNGNPTWINPVAGSVVDTEMSDESTNPVQNKTVKDYADRLIYDISAAHSNTAYESLSAALGIDGENVPSAKRKGGMSIKFVKSIDNNYVQFRYMKTVTTDATFTNPANWQGVDDGSLISYDTDILTKNTLLLNNAYDVSCNSANCKILITNFGTNTNYKHAYIPVVPGEKYHVDGIADYVLRIAFATTNEVTPGGTIPVVAGTSVIEIPANTNIWITIPEGCSYLLLWRKDEVENFVGKVKKLTTGVKTIYPLLTHDIIRSGNGEFSTNNSIASGSCKSTPRFIRLADNIKTFNIATSFTSLSGNLYVFSYGSNFEYLGYQLVTIDTANTDVSVTLDYDATYIKVAQYTGNFAIPIIKLTGAFADDWDTFNPRPVNVKSGGSDSTVFAPGFRRISVLVNVTNPTCCDSIKYVVSYDDGGTTAEAEGILSDVSELPSEGSSGIIYHIESGANAGFYMYINNSWTTVTIQHMLANDTQQLLPDYGMIALPETYTNTGKPTRLIIYCHGAAVNYADAVTDFNTQDLKPEYWLAEGYAVMDIEGNPFNNTDEHCSMPQATDSYVAGYKWAIEHFNLKRDGVFLGGRSMGGGQTVTLMRKECPIPIIAACPNVPALTMATGSSATRKTFWANHCGFTLPEGFVFGDGYIESEKPVFLDNWDKWAKVLPLFSLITDLPLSANGKQDVIDKLWLGAYSDERDNYFKTFHGYAKCPVKLFAINQDEGGLRYAQIAYRILLNSCQITELRVMDSYKDYTGTGTSAHHADTQDPALRTTVTTRFGIEMTNVPIVYIEMLQFWRRYEQGN